MRALVAVALLTLSSPVLAAPVLGTFQLSFSGGHEDGGFGSEGIEDLQEVSLHQPLPNLARASALRVTFDGVITQSLEARFLGNDDGPFTDYCTGTAAGPSLTVSLTQDTQATVTPQDSGFGFCADVGEQVSEFSEAPVHLAFDIPRGSLDFDLALEGYPFTIVYFDENRWDFERSRWEYFSYRTGYRGRLRVEAVPEPGALGLLGLGLVALAMPRRRKAR